MRILTLMLRERSMAMIVDGDKDMVNNSDEQRQKGTGVADDIRPPRSIRFSGKIYTTRRFSSTDSWSSGWSQMTVR
jgi:hypothetical protein